MSHLDNNQEEYFLSLAPSDDKITAFVVTHMGATDEAVATIKELKSYDKLLVGKYKALLKGMELDLSAKDREAVLITGRLFEKTYEYVASQHVLN